MKDTIITAKRKKTELYAFLMCFLLANLLNVYAIIAYDTPIIEIVTQIGYVFLFATSLYLLRVILLIAFNVIRNRINTNNHRIK